MDSLAVQSHVVRNHFSETIDEVVRKSPRLIKRRRDRVIMMSDSHLKAMTDHVQFHVTLEKDPENGEWIASLYEIEDIFTTNINPEEAIMEVARLLIGYSEDYMLEFPLYFSAPNRKLHFPFIMKTLLFESEHALRDSFHVQYQGT